MTLCIAACPLAVCAALRWAWMQGSLLRLVLPARADVRERRYSVHEQGTQYRAQLAVVDLQSQVHGTTAAQARRRSWRAFGGHRCGCRSRSSIFGGADRILPLCLSTKYEYCLWSSLPFVARRVTIQVLACLRRSVCFAVLGASSANLMQFFSLLRKPSSLQLALLPLGFLVTCLGPPRGSRGTLYGIPLLRLFRRRLIAFSRIGGPRGTKQSRSHSVFLELPLPLHTLARPPPPPSPKTTTTTGTLSTILLRPKRPAAPHLKVSQGPKKKRTPSHPRRCSATSLELGSFFCPCTIQPSSSALPNCADPHPRPRASFRHRSGTWAGTADPVAQCLSYSSCSVLRGSLTLISLSHFPLPPPCLVRSRWRAVESASRANVIITHNYYYSHLLQTTQVLVRRAPNGFLSHAHTPHVDRLARLTPFGIWLNLRHPIAGRPGVFEALLPGVSRLPPRPWPACASAGPCLSLATPSLMCV